MARRKRRKFTDEFKADAVKLCEAGGRSVGQVAADLDLTETALREWVKRAAADAGKGPPNVLTTAERDELSELRKRVKRLEMEREILKKAAPKSAGQGNTAVSFSDGVKNPRTFRGRSLSRRATSSKSPWVYPERSVSLGKY